MDKQQALEGVENLTREGVTMVFNLIRQYLASYKLKLALGWLVNKAEDFVLRQVDKIDGNITAI